MPRRAVLTEGQRDALLALPDTEAELVRHWTLSAEDLRTIVSRRRPHNRLGFAVQLCALRHPGRLLRPGELIPHAPLAFVADQLEVAPDVLADHATRGPTRYEQLDTLRDVFGFRQLDRPTRAALQAWLLPIALTTTSGADLARVLLSEFRARRVIVPGITLVERMAAQALLDELLASHPGGRMSLLAWVRQPPGKPGRRSFAATSTGWTLRARSGSTRN